MPEATIQTEYLGQFGRGLWRYIRSRFYAAGQDSFSDPPSQSEDMFEKLLNVMPPVQGDIDRRWGYRLVNSNIAEGASTGSIAYPVHLWSDINAATRFLFVGGATGQFSLNEDGTYAGFNLTGLNAPVRSIVTRGFLYSANGSQSPLKWSPATGGQKFWGTDVNNRTAGTFGPSLPTTVTDLADNSNPWTNPNNIKVLDGVFATVSTAHPPPGTNHPQSNTLQGTSYGFAVPGGNLIRGIQVTVTGLHTGGFGAPQFAVSIKKASGVVGTKTLSFPQTVNSAGSVGGATDLWGSFWTPADVNDAGFGVTITASTGVIGSTAFSVDGVQITVFAEAGPALLSAPVAGAITLVNGRSYAITFYNSKTSTFSDLTQFSASTGPLTAQNQPLTALAMSNDPQIDRKKLLATADGGDEGTLYEVQDLANATLTTTDNMPEGTLLLQNQLQAVLIDGSSVGVADNSPPNSAMNYPILHRGRVYGLVANNLVYSKSNDELITPTDFIAGNYEECFPGLNNFPISASGEQGRGLLSDGTVLYIGTDRRIIRLFGDGPATFLQPQLLFDNVGILNQDVWKLVLIEGNPVGAMWLTPDARVLGSDFNTYQDVGTPIQDVLDSINKTAALTTAWAANVNISVFNLYVLAVPTGNNTQPDTLLVFDVKGRKWFTWQLADTAVGGFWWVALGGTPQFLIQAATGKLYVFDPTLLDDRVGDTPVSFTALARTSWLPLGDGTAYKNLNEIEVSTRDLSGGFNLTVEGASSIQDFLTPRTVVLNAPLVQKPRGNYGVFLAGASTRDRYYRFTFNFADDQTDLLRSYSIQGRISNRI